MWQPAASRQHAVSTLHLWVERQIDSFLRWLRFVEKHQPRHVWSNHEADMTGNGHRTGVVARRRPIDEPATIAHRGIDRAETANRDQTAKIEGVGLIAQVAELDFDIDILIAIRRGVQEPQSTTFSGAEMTVNANASPVGTVAPSA